MESQPGDRHAGAGALANGRVATRLPTQDPRPDAGVLGEKLGLEPADWQHLDVRWDRGGMSPARK